MNFQPDKEAADIANGLFIRMEDFIMLMPGIFGENLFDDNWMDFPFDRNFFGTKFCLWKNGKTSDENRYYGNR